VARGARHLRARRAAPSSPSSLGNRHVRTRPTSPKPRIGSRAELVEYIAGGGKPEADWRIGTEHEKFGFRYADLRPLTHEGEQGIGALLDGIATRFGWERVFEDGQAHRAACATTPRSRSEPAGQFELSGAQLETIHDTCCEVTAHLKEVRAVAEPMGVGLLGMGFQPKWKREEMPWMPKGRYGIMRRYMPTRGNLGLDMMTRTCTVQVNLDFEGRGRHGAQVPRRASRCSRSRPRCSPIRRSRKGSPTGS
jgi:glutamate--cysteine ligase